MIDELLAHEIADRLRDAERTKSPIKQISQLHPELTIEDAYAIQRAGVSLAEADGRVVRGRKIGLTSRTMQQAVGISEPDYGVLYDDMFFGGRLGRPARALHRPADRGRVGVRARYLVGRSRVHDLRRAPGDRVRDACDRDPRRPVPDDRSRHGLDPHHRRHDRRQRRRRRHRDRWAGSCARTTSTCGGSPRCCTATGSSRSRAWRRRCSNHPANGVAWLANRLAGHGVELAAGQLILAGSFTRPVWVQPGDTFHADFGPLGSIAFQFSSRT